MATRSAMRLAIGSIRHRTNTFSAVPTSLSDFAAYRLLSGQEVMEPLRGAPTLIGAVIDASHEAGIELLPTIATEAEPGGVISEGVIQDLCDQLCERLIPPSERPDAVFLELTGSAVAADLPDADAYAVARVRQAVGLETPIVVAVDTAANLSPELVAAATIVTTAAGDRSDAVAAGRRIVDLLIAATIGGRHPVRNLHRIPLLIPLTTDRSASGPLSEVYKLANQYCQEPNVIEVAICTGFPYADTPRTGACVVVTTENDGALAERIADQLAEQVWDRRELLTETDRIINSEAAVHDAMAAQSGTFLLLETGDDPAAGGPGDATGLLWALLDLGARDAAFASIADPSAVTRATAAGAGERVSLSLGARADRRHGYPIDVDAHVSRISDGRLPLGSSSKRAETLALGRTVVLEAEGRHGGDVQIIVTERPVSVDSPAILRSLGIEPTSKRIIAIKGSGTQESGLVGVVDHAALVGTPGITVPTFEFFDYRHLQRPVYPLDAGRSD